MDSIVKKVTFEEVHARIEESIRSFAPDVDLSANSAIGQIIAVVAREATAAYDYARHCALQSWRPTATGAALDAIGESVGVPRLRGAAEQSMVYCQGTPVSNDEVKVVRVVNGRYAYLRSSVRYQGTNHTEQSLLLSGAAVSTGALLVHPSSTVATPVPMQALPGTSLSAVIIEGRLPDGETINGDGWTIYGCSRHPVAGTDDEPDSAYRARIKAGPSRSSHTAEGIQASLLAKGVSAIVTENAGPYSLATGQPPHTILVEVVSSAGLSNDQISNAIRESRPAGISSWAGASGTAHRGEMWGRATSAGVAVAVLSTTPSIAASARPAIEAVIRREIEGKSGLLLSAKIQAACVVAIPELQSIEITLNGARQFNTGGTSATIRGNISW